MTIATAALKTTGPLMLVDNMFSDTQYPNHSITANEAATDHEASLVGNGRRRADDDWRPTTQNSAAWIQVTCDTVRGANCLILDRGHNLGGKTIALQVSGEGTAWNDVFSIAVPSSAQPGSPGDAVGVKSYEGAIIKTFDPHFSKYWRLSISAMGAGLVPQVVGLWVGTAFTPDHARKPYADNSSTYQGGKAVSDAGWRGSPTPARPRGGTLRYALNGPMQYVQGRLHVEENFGAGRPMWILHDWFEGERAVLAMRNGPLAFQLAGNDTAWRTIDMPWVEHEPRLYP